MKISCNVHGTTGEYTCKRGSNLRSEVAWSADELGQCDLESATKVAFRGPAKLSQPADGRLERGAVPVFVQAECDRRRVGVSNAADTGVAGPDLKLVDVTVHQIEHGSPAGRWDIAAVVQHEHDIACHCTSHRRHSALSNSRKHTTLTSLYMLRWAASARTSKSTNLNGMQGQRSAAIITPALSVAR